MVKAPISKSWIVPMASLIAMITGMLGDTLHPGIEVDQAHIETLLMMLLGSGAIGAANSMHKRKTAVEKPKEEPSTDEVTEEIAEKVEEEVEKVKAVVKEELIKEVQKVPPQMFKKLMTPEEFSELSPQQQDQYTSSGGIVTRFIKNTEGIKWNHTLGIMILTLTTTQKKAMW